jgi:hypothetical protein
VFDRTSGCDTSSHPRKIAQSFAMSQRSRRARSHPSFVDAAQHCNRHKRQLARLASGRLGRSGDLEAPSRRRRSKAQAIPLGGAAGDVRDDLASSHGR